MQELERRELQAIPRRIEELEQLVARQRRQEGVLQERFKALKRRVDHPDGEPANDAVEDAGPSPMEA